MFRSSRRDVVFPQMEHGAFAAGIALQWRERPNLPFDSLTCGIALHDRGYGELDEDEIGAVEQPHPMTSAAPNRHTSCRTKEEQ